MNFVCCFLDPLSPLQISGGNVGFDKKVWEIVEHKKGETPSITFKCHSHDGEEGSVYSVFLPHF